MPTNKHRAPASERKAVIVFLQKMLNMNNSNSGTRIGYIKSLILGLIPVKKVKESCSIIIAERAINVIAVQNIFRL